MIDFSILHASAPEVKHYTRAKYYRTPAGAMKLVQIQQMSVPAFRVPGFEEPEKLSKLFDTAADACADNEPTDPAEEETSPEDIEEDITNKRRALRRAKITAFDKILCNPDLDTFATFTLSPEAVGDRATWGDCYKCLRTWLCNRVNRHGLKYIVCPERHIAGGIHFHGVMNRPALDLIQATNAHTGQPLTHNGKPLFNITSWRYGYSSAALVDCSALDREKVAKYIFKYMGKQGIYGMIGGRYVLSGGDLATPFYLYGESPEEFTTGETPTGHAESENSGILYREWNYI